MKIDGVTALVTGGSAGIGAEIALQLVALGATVVIVARDAERAAAIAARAPGRIETLIADLARPDEQDRVISEVGARWPDLTILVNNAGVQVNLPEIGIGDAGLMAAFRAEIEVNLTAPVALSFGLMPILARQKQAAIVNISSGLAIAPKKTAPVYCATKAGLRIFSRALRYRCEEAAPNVSVMDAVMPLVDTGMTRGRGKGKIQAADAARAVIAGLSAGRSEVWVGKARLLKWISRIAPSLAYRLLREG